MEYFREYFMHRFVGEKKDLFFVDANRSVSEVLAAVTALLQKIAPVLNFLVIAVIVCFYAEALVGAYGGEFAISYIRSPEEARDCEMIKGTKMVILITTFKRTKETRPIDQPIWSTT